MIFRAKANLASANKKVVEFWHPTKNGELSPGDVSLFSHKRVWWKCSKSQEWQASIGNVTRGRGCPRCWWRDGLTQQAIFLRGSLDKCYPAISAQWHPKKNGDLLANQVSSRCDKKVWWLSSFGHEWLARVAARSGGYGCPKCGLGCVDRRDARHHRRRLRARAAGPKRTSRKEAAREELSLTNKAKSGDACPTPSKPATPTYPKGRLT